MSYIGSPIGAAISDTNAMLRAITRVAVGGAIEYHLDMWKPLRNRYLAPYVGGQYVGSNIWIDNSGQAIFRTLNTPNQVVFFEDAGPWPSFPAGYDPGAQAKNHQEFTTKNFKLTWSSTPAISPAINDAQLNSFVITGAQRGLNCAADPLTPTRAKLSYSMLTVAGVHQLSIWRETDTDGVRKLVAYGTRTGNGSITCSAVNDSGLTVVTTLTYTTDITPGNAWIELKWPASFELYWSTGAINFALAPNAIITDKTANDYEYWAAGLPNGTIHYAAIPRDDEGDRMATPAEAGTVTIRAAPLPATGIYLAGTAASPTLIWTEGESGCSWNVYRSDPEAPVNYGSWTTPAIIGSGMTPDGLGNWTLAIPAITGYAATTGSTAYTTLKSACDTAAAALITAFNAGQTGFTAAITTYTSAVSAAIAAFATTLGLDVTAAQTYLSNSVQSLLIASAQYTSGTASGWTVIGSDVQSPGPSPYLASGNQQITPTGGTGAFNVNDVISIGAGTEQYNVLEIGTQLTVNPPIAVDKLNGDAITLYPIAGATWTAAIQPYVVAALAQLGTLLRGQASLYTLPGIPAPEESGIDVTLYDMGAPYYGTPPRFRFAVAAIKGGVQEQTFQEFDVQFHDDGTIMGALPNQAQFSAIRFSGLQVQADINVIDDNSGATAAFVDLYVVTQGSAINYATPSASVALPAPAIGFAQATVLFTVSTSGVYDIACKARSSVGERNIVPQLKTHWISNDTPAALVNVLGEVAGQA